MILGVDVGSTTTKMVLMENNEIVWYKIEDVGVVIEEDVLSKMIKEVEQNYPIDKIIATGYGRHKISFADKVVPEVIALGKGANYFFNDADGVIDIGGQDTKVLKIDKNGKVIGEAKRYGINNKVVDLNKKYPPNTKEHKLQKLISHSIRKEKRLTKELKPLLS